MLSAAAIIYGYGELAIVCISARVQGKLKSKQRQVSRFTIEEDVAKHVRLCNGGVNGLDESSLCNH